MAISTILMKSKCFHCQIDAEELQVNGKSLLFCSRCTVASYCSKKCQVEDFKKHKEPCKKLVAKPRKAAKALYDAIAELTGFENWNDEKLRNYAQDQVQYTGETMLYEGLLHFQEQRRDVFVGKSKSMNFDLFDFYTK